KSGMTIDASGPVRDGRRHKPRLFASSGHRSKNRQGSNDVIPAAFWHSPGGFCWTNGEYSDQSNTFSAASGEFKARDCAVDRCVGSNASVLYIRPAQQPSNPVPVLQAEPGQPGELVVSWFPAASNYALQEAPSPHSDVWADSPSGTNNPAIVPIDAETKFFR